MATTSTHIGASTSPLLGILEEPWKALERPYLSHTQPFQRRHQQAGNLSLAASGVYPPPGLTLLAVRDIVARAESTLNLAGDHFDPKPPKSMENRADRSEMSDRPWPAIGMPRLEILGEVKL
jgi:hypothetical protein